MNYLKKFIIAFAVFMAIVMAVFVIGIRSVGESERDIIDFNLTVHQIQNDLMKGIPRETVEENYDCIIILDTALENEEVAECFKRGDLVMDLSLNGEYAGKVSFPDDYNKIKASKNSISRLFIICWGAILIGGFVLFAALYALYIKPMNELERFSVQIANGNLSEPIPMNRANMIEGFVSAFDMMREQLIESKEREMASEKARKSLVTDLSHDIKTPVSVIKAACEMLELKIGKNESLEENEKADAIGKITVISDKAETINSLMSNVMHYTLEELEELKVNVKDENTQEVTRIFSNLMGYDNIIMDNEIKPCIVKMDKLRLEQVIDNVVGNSNKYAGTDIHVDFSEAENDFIKIRIRDEGPGVKEDELPLLTEKYFRGSNSEEQTGYGLGLYLVKWYMDKMGGGMEYYNDNGFVVELFLKKA
jgi:signal transduction histidine kinase